MTHHEDLPYHLKLAAHARELSNVVSSEEMQVFFGDMARHYEQLVDAALQDTSNLSVQAD